jgi:hypothetical protein
MSAKEDITIVNWDRAMLRRFKSDYAEAVECGEDSFRFDGNDYLVGYAKYLICYLEGKLS